MLPNGTIQIVTSKNKDLWFALRVSDAITDVLSVSRAELILREVLTTLYAGLHFDFLFTLKFGLTVSSGYRNQVCSPGTSAGRSLGIYFLSLGDSRVLSFDE